MKTGRNEPCPCGSGKKYKKCCLNKEMGLQKNLTTSQGQNGDNDDDSFEKTAIMAMNNLRKYLLEDKPHIKEYKKARKLHAEICDSMANYYDSGKFEQKMVGAANQFPFSRTKRKIKEVRLIESSFDMETREGTQAFFNTVIYKNAPNINCITEEFIESHRFRKPEKIALLQSMLDSKAGLFEVTSIDSDEGYVNIKEVFTAQEYKITDVGMSGNKNFNTYYIHMRIITYNGISFSAGSSLMFYKTDLFIQNFIKTEKKNYNPDGEYSRFLDLYNVFLKNMNKKDSIKIVPNTFR